MRISVVIPTFNRCETLVECVNALDRQTYNKADFDVVVVDDGSSDNTAERVLALVDHWEGRLHYVHQPNGGPATARNLGVCNASGEVILFIGDDIIATPSLVEQHANHHVQHPDAKVAILGKVVWSPKLELTPIMKWIHQSGAQFDYGSSEQRQVTGGHFFTSNVSLKRTFFLHNGGFDEEFPYAAYEDIELGLRLEQDGMRLLYQPDALAYHDHYTTVESFHRRAALVGASAYILERKHPGFITRSTLRHTIAKRIVLGLGPIISLIGTEQMKVLLSVVQSKQLFWQAFHRQAMRERGSR